MNRTHDPGQGSFGFGSKNDIKPGPAEWRKVLTKGEGEGERTTRHALTYHSKAAEWNLDGSRRGELRRSAR